jgi:molecular chaperone DnaK
VFSTADDSQTAVTIHVLQGEREMARGNKSLGQFNLTDIPPAPRGMPQIEVTFDIDANGILKVSAQDKATGRSQHITITASSGLSDEEVEKMVQDAKKFAGEDQKRRDQIEARNAADSAVYTSEKTLKDLGEQVPAAVKGEVESKASALRGMLETAGTEELKQRTQELNEALQKIGATMYQQQPGGGGGPSTPPPGGDGGSDEDVVEGEFSKN